MEAGNILVKSEMIALADEAIAKLEQNRSDIRTVNAGIRNAMRDDIIVGALGDSVQQHLSGLIELNSSFDNLIGLDIQAYNELKNILSSLSGENEVLDGAAIDNDIYDCEVNIASIQLQLNWNSRSINPFFSALIAGATSYVVYLQGRLAWYNRRLNKLREKQALYDSIDAATANLFNQNDELRSVIRDGYTYISTEWNGDVCTIPQAPLQSAAWRNELSRINEGYISRYSEQYYTIDENGNLIVNWEEISLVFQSNPDDLDPYQLIAISRMYPLMSDEELSIVFDYGMISDDPDNHPYGLSRAFGITIEYYEDNALSNEQWEYNNDVTRSTAMRQTYDYILWANSSNGYDCSVSFSHSNYSADTNVPSDTVYEYDITVSFDYSPTSDQEFYDVMNTTPVWDWPSNWDADITVFSYTCTEDGWNSNCIAALESYLGQSSIFDAEDFRRDPVQYLIDHIGEISLQSALEIGGYLPKIGDVVSVPGSVYGLASDLADAQESLIVYDTSTGLLDYQSINQNMCTGGCLVIVNHHGPYKDSVSIANADCNETALQSNIDMYNEALDSNVTYTQLLDDYNLFVESGADCSLLRADSDVDTDNTFVSYMRWRNGGSRN